MKNPDIGLPVGNWFDGNECISFTEKKTKTSQFKTTHSFSVVRKIMSTESSECCLSTVKPLGRASKKTNRTPIGHDTRYSSRSLCGGKLQLGTRLRRKQKSGKSLADNYV